MGEGPVYDKKHQFDQITSGLLEDEVVHAVYDAIGIGTGFLGVTSLRVILQDKSFVGGRVALTSIPFGRIVSLSVLSDKEWGGRFFSSSSIAIATSGANYQVDFRGSDKAHHAHNLIMWYLVH